MLRSGLDSDIIFGSGLETEKIGSELILGSASGLN